MVEAPGQNAVASTPAERRLLHEWQVLAELVRLNPARLDDAQAFDATFLVTLGQTPALGLGGEIVEQHRLRFEFPKFFPTLPLELYLDKPMAHPNIHPVTGFVCLWNTHRVEHSVEHALHRAAAMLGWQLMNPDPQHVMQPEARDRAGLAQRLHAPVLLGIDHSAQAFVPLETPLRRRLS